MNLYCRDEKCNSENNVRLCTSYFDSQVNVLKVGIQGQAPIDTVQINSLHLLHKKKYLFTTLQNYMRKIKQKQAVVSA